MARTSRPMEPRAERAETRGPEAQGDRARGLDDREAVRQGRDPHHERGRPSIARSSAFSSGSAEPRSRARHRRLSARARGRDLRPGVERQDDARAARGGRDPAPRRRRRLHRRRARARRRLRAPARRAGRGPARLAARHRRAGARDRRRAAALGRGRPRRGRLGGGARAARRDRGRDGRPARGPAGAADEPGAAQAHGHRLEVERDGDLHQPDPHEDRRDVRQPRDHHAAATRSSSTPRCGSTCGASRPSRRARRWSATARA